jgi:hypothetical protein
MQTIQGTAAEIYADPEEDASALRTWAVCPEVVPGIVES